MTKTVVVILILGLFLATADMVQSSQYTQSEVTSAIVSLLHREREHQDLTRLAELVYLHRGLWKKIKRAGRKATRGVTKGVRKVAKGVKKGAKGVGKGASRGVRTVGRTMGRGAKTVGSAARTVGKGVKKVAGGFGSIGSALVRKAFGSKIKLLKSLKELIKNRDLRGLKSFGKALIKEVAESSGLGSKLKLAMTLKNLIERKDFAALKSFGKALIANNGVPSPLGNSAVLLEAASTIGH